MHRVQPADFATQAGFFFSEIRWNTQPCGRVGRSSPGETATRPSDEGYRHLRYAAVQGDARNGQS